MKNNSILLKRIGILFLVIIVPLVLLTGVFLFWNNHRLTRKNLQIYSLKAKSYVNTLDSNFSQIYNSAVYVLSYSQFEKLVYRSQVMNTYEKAETVNHLREFFSNMKASHDMVKSVRVYVRPMKQIYNSSNYEKGSVEQLTEESWEHMANLNVEVPSHIVFDEGRMLMVLKTQGKNPDGIIEVELSLDRLKKEFDRQNQYDRAYYLFDFQEGNYVLDNMRTDSLRNAVLEAVYKEGAAEFRVDGERYYAIKADFEQIAASYIQVIPGRELVASLYMTNMLTIIWLMVMSVCVYVFFTGIIRMIHRPLGKLVHAFQKVESGNLSIRINETAKSEFHYLYKGFNDMTGHLETLINEVYEQKMLLQKAEFKQLQAQINPHFLYNSFFMLQRTIQNNMQEEAVQISKELGIYFQYITRNQADFVYLKDEYLHANIYSSIQARRFEGRIQMEFGELPAMYTYCKVPRLILQPIIENAYNYGLENKCSDGFLRVGFQNVPEGLSITIEDNGDELSDEKIDLLNQKLESAVDFSDSAEITGLVNIYKRIRSYYNNDSTLKVSRSELGGLQVTIWIATKEDNLYEKIADR